MLMLFVSVIALYVVAVTGDQHDWVNVPYVLSEARRGPASEARSAIASIARGADILARKGPWSVTNERGVLPPSRDARDYLSWAPYHWPDCRWCSKSGRSQLAHTGDPVVSPNESSTDTAGGTLPSDDSYDDDTLEESAQAPSVKSKRYLAHRQRMMRLHRRHTGRQVSLDSIDVPEVATSVLEGLPVSTPLIGTASGAPPSTTDARSTTTRPPAQAAARTTRTTCTASPTTSMAPSATWTTCPYVVRDGKVNTDVRTIKGPGSINAVSQYVLYACISTAFNRSSPHSHGAAVAIDTYFLSPSTGMNPNVKFGQVVRGPGPGGQAGTFTGILDIRGLVKVLNGILLLKGLGHPEWTNKRESAMRAWVSQYSKWLTNSDIGKYTASRPNNHGSYFVSQLAAARLYQGLKDDAISALNGFFKKQFADQIAASGEQPFEAVRTRPYHYRCFNLEALIANAKLGDELGLDLWSVRSKYGATIQTAMDFIMMTDPKRENVQEALPHVAAVAAAYGDPTGKYGAFLKKHLNNYESRPFWFYDQPKAFHGGSNSAKAPIGRRDGQKIAFTCPAVFQDATSVELDNGVFVTCEQLRPLYETSVEL